MIPKTEAKGIQKPIQPREIAECQDSDGGTLSQGGSHPNA